MDLEKISTEWEELSKEYKKLEVFSYCGVLYINSWIILSNFSTIKILFHKKGGKQWIFGTTGIIGSIATALFEGYIASAISHESN